MKLFVVSVLFFILAACTSSTTTQNLQNPKNPLPDDNSKVNAFLRIGEGSIHVSTALPCAHEHVYEFEIQDWTQQQVIDSLKAYQQFCLAHQLQSPVPVDSAIQFLNAERYQVDMELHYLEAGRMQRHYHIMSENQYLLLSYGFKDCH